MPSLHESTESRHARKRLVMIMGVQRSGTTALFEALATARGVTARNESADDDLYLDYFLRPEPEIRSILAGLPGTVRLKPVRESEVRSTQAVAQEYAAYDLRIVWLYRDPVNVFDSYVRRGWITADPISSRRFADEWQRRNATAITDAGMLGNRLVVVRYEDLVVAPSLIQRIAESLGIFVTSTLGGDAAAGRNRHPSDICRIIDVITAEVRSRLDRLRVIPPAFSSTPQSHAINAGDQAALHGGFPRAGPFRLDTETDKFVSFGYELSTSILSRSKPLRPTPSRGVQPRGAGARDDFAAVFESRRHDIAKRIRAAVSEWFASLPVDQTFDVLERLIPFAAFSTAIWLDVPESLAGKLHGEVRGLYLTADSSAPSPDWERLCDALLKQGLIADLCARGLLDRQDVLGFLCDTAMRIFAVPTVVCNALVALADQPRALALARQSPAMIPGVLAEATRLVPMWYSLRRRMTESLGLSECRVPKGAVVEVFVATANRDPAAFDGPDDLRPDRRSPAPILLDDDTAPYSSLTDSPAWGCRHILFDVSTLVLERLLAGPLTLTFPVHPRAVIRPMPNGELLQVPRELLVSLKPRAAWHAIGGMFGRGRKSRG